MSSQDTELIEILEKHYKLGLGSYFIHQKTTQAILNHFKDVVKNGRPEKIKLDKAVYQNEGDGNANERIGYKHGYNDACQDYYDNLLGLLK